MQTIQKQFATSTANVHEGKRSLRNNVSNKRSSNEGSYSRSRSPFEDKLHLTN